MKTTMGTGLAGILLGAIAIATSAGCTAETGSAAASTVEKAEGAVTYAYTGVSDQGSDMPCKLTLETSDGKTVAKVSLATYVLDHSFEIGDVTKYQTGAVMPKDVPPSANDASGNGPELSGGEISQTPSLILSKTFPFVTTGVTLSTRVEGYNKGPLFERLLSVTQVETLKLKGSVDAVESFTYDAQIRLFPLGLVKVDSAEASCHDMTLDMP
jgi:hypothetical protein